MLWYLKVIQLQHRNHMSSDFVNCNLHTTYKAERSDFKMTWPSRVIDEMSKDEKVCSPNFCYVWFRFFLNSSL